MDTFKAKLVSTEAFQTGHTLVTYTCFALRICISLWVEIESYLLVRLDSQKFTHTHSKNNARHITTYMYVHMHIMLS